MEIGFAPATAAGALGLVAFTSIVGQIALGHLSDRIGREWVWTLSCAGFMATYALLLAMRQRPTAALLYLMVAAQGVLGYGLASVFGAIPAELFQGKHYGTIFGTLSLASIVGGAIGPARCTTARAATCSPSGSRSPSAPCRLARCGWRLRARCERLRGACRVAYNEAP